MYLAVSVSLTGIQSAFGQPAAATVPVPVSQFELALGTCAAPPAAPATAYPEPTGVQAIARS